MFDTVRYVSLIVVLAVGAFAKAQDLSKNRDTRTFAGTAYRNSFGTFPSPATLGDKMFAEYFQIETHKLAEASLSSFHSKLDWDQQKEELRRQLFEMLSLDPLPTKTELQATVTGTIEQPEFTVEKLHFQSRPGLYVTANVYIPKSLAKPAPAILYVCGHGPAKIDGVNYGNKVTYQHHGAWFARNGYVCIILDSVQLGEIEGIHHGTHHENMWWWNSRGYTSAGAEAWNCIRAIDYWQTRPDVDGQRIGVTGRSGGGAYSWWIAALDDRIQTACPVAGITDLQNHVVDGCVEGHCDCMFMVNTYRWDYAKVAALMAPRPLLICNTDKDRIFPLDGIVRLHSEVRRIYDLFDVPEKLGLLITEGPHKDTQELQLPVMRWFNKWLKNEDAPVANYAEKLFTPQQLKVFEKLPEDELTSRCHETFTELANDSESFDSSKSIAALSKKTFGAWPSVHSQERVSGVETKLLATTEKDGVQFTIFEFESQPGIRLRFYLAQPSKIAVESLYLEIVDHSNWVEKLQMLQVGFADVLKDELNSAGIDTIQPIGPNIGEQFANWTKQIRESKLANIAFTVRGIGLTRLSEDVKYQTHVRRRFMLLGATLASSQVWDVTRASKAVRSLAGMSSIPLHFHASPEMTEVAAFAALYEDKLSSLTLAQMPRSDKESPDFLNWSRLITPKQLLTMVELKTIVKVATE